MGLTEDELQFVSIVFVSRDALPPESVNAGTLADPAKGQLVPTIERIAAPFHGRVEGLRDGTIIVAFPANSAATDQAAMAARTALAIRDLALRLPITLATGRASAHIGSLYSDAAIRASALSTHCSSTETSIPIDETTRGLLDMRFSIENRSGVYFLINEDPFGEPGRLLCGRPAPFVGREREVRLIEQIFDEVIHEPRSAAAILVGETGSGKSRLGRELLAILSRSEPSTEIWVARGEAVRAGGAFGILASALQRAADIREGESMDVRHKKLAKFVQERVPGPNAASILAFLGEIAETRLRHDSDNQELQAARRDPVLMRDRIRFAVEDLVYALTENRPLVLLLEDLHWGDLPSIKVLEMAAQKLRDRPVFILALGRPELLEIFPKLFTEWSPSTIRLSGLSRRACQNLISRVVGSRVTSEVMSSIIERSAGHPLFLEELVRTIAETTPTSAHALPETVLAMVQSRVAKVSPEARRVLRAASIFGETFWQPLPTYRRTNPLAPANKKSKHNAFLRSETSHAILVWDQSRYCVNVKKVLLVDDDEYVRRIAAMSLRKLGGFEVLLASSGAEGLVMAEQLIPDLILLDIIMPGLDGIVTITELKKSPKAKAIPVIFLTGARELTPPERARALGALDVIYKPIDPLRLPSQALEIVAASRKK